MISNICEAVGMVLVSIAAFEVAQPLGLFVSGVLLVLLGFSFTDKSAK